VEDRKVDRHQGVEVTEILVQGSGAENR
jgi:hypothetical protein